MAESAELHQCPSCGKALASDAPAGLCPACLLKQASSGPSEIQSAILPDETPKVDGASDAAATEAVPLPKKSSKRKPLFTPPTIAELTPHLPGFEISELVGQGGMGAVYKARQKHLDRIVALKILPTELSEDEGFTERFSREARSLARMSHPNLVTVFDFGKAGPYHFICMEYIDGANLRQVLKTGQLSPNQALALVPQLCEALQYAHDEGIVHRDIKPENLLLDKKGRLKITDFGLAKLIDSDPGFTLTGSRDVMGTIHYMAPEQIEKTRDVDHRADIYSMGVVFYEMLTGELPLGRFQPPSHKIELDIRFDEVVLKSLEKDPARRYQNASDVQKEVNRINDDPTGKPAAPSNSQKPDDNVERVSIGLGGLHVKNKKEEVRIGWNGIHINDQNNPKDSVNLSGCGKYPMMIAGGAMIIIGFTALAGWEAGKIFLGMGLLMLGFDLFNKYYLDDTNSVEDPAYPEKRIRKPLSPQTKFWLILLGVLGLLVAIPILLLVTVFGGRSSVSQTIQASPPVVKPMPTVPGTSLNPLTTAPTEPKISQELADSLKEMRAVPVHQDAQVKKLMEAYRSAYQSQRLDEATELLRQALALRPDDPELKIRLQDITRLQAQKTFETYSLIENKSTKGWTYDGPVDNFGYQPETNALFLGDFKDSRVASRELNVSEFTLQGSFLTPVGCDRGEIQVGLGDQYYWACGVRMDLEKAALYVEKRNSQTDDVIEKIWSESIKATDQWTEARITLSQGNATFKVNGMIRGSVMLDPTAQKRKTVRLAVKKGQIRFNQLTVSPSTGVQKAAPTPE